jgi:hypothetical protein
LRRFNEDAIMRIDVVGGQPQADHPLLLAYENGELRHFDMTAFLVTF